MKTILFDLDGTLLQMDDNEFLKKYEEVFIPFFKKLGYDTKTLLNDYNSSFYKMIKNDGGRLNKEVFFEALNKFDKDKIEDDLNLFYNTDLDYVKEIIKSNGYPAKIIKALKLKGYNLILATNPLFPPLFTHKRIRWAGLEPSDFSYITTYDNSYYSKPSREYYLDIIKNNNLNINNLVMIGNDIDDDFSLLPKEIDKLLITDFLINRRNKDINIPSMTLKELYNKIVEE